LTGPVTTSAPDVSHASSSVANQLGGATSSSSTKTSASSFQHSSTDFSRAKGIPGSGSTTDSIGYGVPFPNFSTTFAAEPSASLSTTTIRIA
jgi:hypothetical protein